MLTILQNNIKRAIPLGKVIEIASLIEKIRDAQPLIGLEDGLLNLLHL